MSELMLCCAGDSAFEAFSGLAQGFDRLVLQVNVAGREWPSHEWASYGAGRRMNVERQQFDELRAVSLAKSTPNQPLLMVNYEAEDLPVEPSMFESRDGHLSAMMAAAYAVTNGECGLWDPSERLTAYTDAYKFISCYVNRSDLRDTTGGQYRERIERKLASFAGDSRVVASIRSVVNGAAIPESHRDVFYAVATELSIPAMLWIDTNSLAERQAWHATYRHVEALRAVHRPAAPDWSAVTMEGPEGASNGANVQGRVRDPGGTDGARQQDRRRASQARRLDVGRGA
jgi:hypothetical protein